MPLYEVKQAGWLTNARGHGAHYEPTTDGRKKPTTIELTPEQAEYLLRSEQVAELGAGEGGTLAVEQAGRPLDMPAVQTPEEVDTKVSAKTGTKGRLLT